MSKFKHTHFAADGTILSHEERDWTAEEIREQALSRLKETDAKMARVVEDLVAALKLKGALLDDDLPTTARQLIEQRRADRGRV